MIAKDGKNWRVCFEDIAGALFHKLRRVGETGFAQADLICSQYFSVRFRSSKPASEMLKIMMLQKRMIYSSLAIHITSFARDKSHRCTPHEEDHHITKTQDSVT